ncbi:MAG: glutamine synthetase [Alphaproteobacteria bacterium]|nr:glutamine synthetase [Alphaproteobacteria bacterium]
MNVSRPAKADEVSGFASAHAELESFLAQYPQIQFVDCVFVDLCGQVRGKRYPRDEVEKVFKNGLQIPYSLYLLDARGEMANPLGRGKADGDPDGTAWPVPGTLTAVSWAQRPHAQVLMSLGDERGQPYLGEPRNLLKRVAERFRDLDLTPVVAGELEFFLIDRERRKTGAPQPPLLGDEGARDEAASTYGIDDLENYRDFLTAVAEATAMQRIPATVASAECAAAQFQINLRHEADAVRAGDHTVFLRQVVKNVARLQDMDATFMAKPYLNFPGSGLHVHVSLAHKSGRNVFDDGSPEGSETLRHAIAGVQAIMGEGMAMFAPNSNSYRRFADNSLTPRNRRWGYNNRSTSIRVPAGANEARRIEHRVAGADANAYLVTAVVLAGAHYGIVNRLDPGAPFDGNAASFVDETLPMNPDAALLALENGNILREYLGRAYVDLYCATKRTELRRYREAITSREYEWYL